RIVQCPRAWKVVHLSLLADCAVTMVGGNHHENASYTHLVAGQILPLVDRIGRPTNARPVGALGENPQARPDSLFLGWYITNRVLGIGLRDCDPSAAIRKCQKWLSWRSPECGPCGPYFQACHSAHPFVRFSPAIA